MLHIIGCSPVPLSRVVIDESIPFKFSAYESVLPGCYIWQTGNLQTSLMEMRLDRFTKAIYGATLTLYNGKIENMPLLNFDQCQTVTGLPIIDHTKFAGNLTKEFNDFYLARKGNSIFIMLKSQIVPERCFRAGRVGFFETDGYLCAIGFFDLTDGEIEIAGRTLRL